MDIRIDGPFWLLLLIPIAIYMAYTWKSSAMRFVSKGTILFALRSTAIVALVFALAAPYVTLRANEEQILFVVDRSMSIAGEIGRAHV